MLVDAVVLDGLVVDHLFDQQRLALAVVLIYRNLRRLHQVQVLFLHLHPQHLPLRVSAEQLVLQLCLLLLPTLSLNHCNI